MRPCFRAWASEGGVSCPLRCGDIKGIVAGNVWNLGKSMWHVYSQCTLSLRKRHFKEVQGRVGMIPCPELWMRQSWMNETVVGLNLGSVTCRVNDFWVSVICEGDVLPTSEGVVKSKLGHNKRDTWSILKWIGKAECWRIDAFKLWCYRSLLDSKETKPVDSKGNQPWIFIGRTDAEDEAPILWPPDVKSWPWCWERWRAGGEGGNRGWDGWMASLTQWAWVWAKSRR